MLHSIIDNPALAAEGAAQMHWYRERMGVLAQFHQRYAETRPYAGKKLLVCMHCEPKAAVRTEALLAGGAEQIVFIGNLGSTKPPIAAYLSTLPRVTVMAKQGDTLEDLRHYVDLALQEEHDLFMDNGAALLQAHWKGNYPWQPLGAIEETRSGRLILDREGINSPFPVLVIDDSPVKRLVENEAGVGQSVVDGFMRATGMLLGGKEILIIGYGFCGSGIAQRFRALGAFTSVWDTDPLRLLKAKIEGHRVGKLEELLPKADVVLTVTGRYDILGRAHFLQMKDGAIICNAGHYNMEIDVEALGALSTDKQLVREGIHGYTVKGKRLYLLQNANPLNLSAGGGNPIEIMELGYALQLLSLEEIMNNADLPKGAQDLPPSVNEAACRLSLGF